jgi:hypothetical protein
VEAQRVGMLFLAAGADRVWHRGTRRWATTLLAAGIEAAQLFFSRMMPMSMRVYFSQPGSLMPLRMN